MSLISSRSKGRTRRHGRGAQSPQPLPGAAAEGSQARRPRHGLRQGPVLRPRDQGPEVALRIAQDAGRLRGRSDADRYAAAETARQHVGRRDADRAVPNLDAARQPPRPRGAFRRGRRGDAGRTRHGRADQEHEDRHQDPWLWRADKETVRHRARFLEDGKGKDRGCRRYRQLAAW